VTDLKFAFVEEPSNLPQVIVDLNASDDAYLSAEDFDPGVPGFEGGPESVGGRDTYRTMQYTFVIRGSYSIVAPVLQNVARELVRPRGWLMLQATPSSEPMFLRYYKTEQQEGLGWEESDFETWTLPVSLDCDPWFTGPLTTAFSGATFSSNPTLSNGLFVDVPPVKGDFDTPVILWTPDATNLNNRWLTTETDPPITGIYYAEAEAGTLGTDTALVANDANYSGAGSNSVETSFATDSTLIPRITNLALPSGTPIGNYRVLAVVRSSNNTSVYRVKVSGGQEVTWTPGGTSRATVSLGVVSVPAASALPFIGYGDASAASSSVDLYAGRDSGTGLLRFDYIRLVPAWQQSLYVTGLDTGSTPAVLDGVNRTSYYLSTASPLDSAAKFLSTVPTGIPIGTGWPMLSPGKKTRLHFGPKPAPVLAATATTLSGAYYPKYLHLRPDGS